MLVVEIPGKSRLNTYRRGRQEPVSLRFDCILIRPSTCRNPRNDAAGIRYFPTFTKDRQWCIESGTAGDSKT